ncbi:MAG: hypothetical protein U9R19_09585, partial [Bacteroidota bacterium]|nr:hypothetical protein [Bacteroidota bacterium]
ALKEKDIIIQVRSVFLQGLFFIDPENLPDHFLQVRHKLQLLHNFSSNNNLPIKDLCLLFVLNNEFINTVIIGVDSLKNLEDNINIDWEKNKHHLPKITELNLQENNEDILIPSKWKI